MGDPTSPQNPAKSPNVAQHPRSPAVPDMAREAGTEGGDRGA